MAKAQIVRSISLFFSNILALFVNFPTVHRSALATSRTADPACGTGAASTEKPSIGGGTGSALRTLSAPPLASCSSLSSPLRGPQPSLAPYRLFVKARFRPQSPRESLAYCVLEKRLAPGLRQVNYLSHGGPETQCGLRPQAKADSSLRCARLRMTCHPEPSEGSHFLCFTRKFSR